MSKTITRLFDDYDDAKLAVEELEQIGVPNDNISIIAHHPPEAPGERTTLLTAEGDVVGKHVTDDVGVGAAAGGLLGGGVGLLAGVGVLAVPGIGPVLAAGWLVSTLVGAAVGVAGGATTGGMIGALKHEGDDELDADIYAEGLRRGGSVVSAKVDDRNALEVEATLERLNGVRAADRATVYREQGWTRFDDTAPPYTVDQVAAERLHYTR